LVYTFAIYHYCFADNELEVNAVIKEYLITVADGKKEELDYYPAELILNTA
jgi:hypothetical protein